MATFCCKLVAQPRPKLRTTRLAACEAKSGLLTREGRVSGLEIDRQPVINLVCTI